ncbi:putative peptide ABC transporter permease protein [Microlunatus phosphovorus NM-1]|mgnify:CR=1 FL=1|uniref:Putative peptide ABC transporter permease protein n=1 Tax=Microlunatus phosphovorus (strain ATCC 700054 / DSM 10555 / JCM 9379 / NBRC 101784 / NCIMB 13414 / VKM Ac-1990 / NM-1) TaxID=1032480 RepID=F5XST8_MICPN|nr:ABC transporter permease [Microlunatus phosphovorus]BAK37346.1 putative peptide ABC transporter permease protein [Microlunatus phosphovorus NM-1]
MTERPTQEGPGITGADVVGDEVGTRLINQPDPALVAQPGVTAIQVEGRSLWQDAWTELRHNPLFWISAALICFFALMAIWPSLFTNGDPNFADLSRAREKPSADAWFGMDGQGYDVYTRTIYGARASILVGVMTSIFVLIIGLVFGIIAGYRAGWVDSFFSRFGEIFIAIPMLLGGIVFLTVFPNKPGDPYVVIVGKIVLVLTLLSWPRLMRIMRSSVVQVKPAEYVAAARALGSGPWRIVRSHIMPNAIAPVIVIATIDLGVYITIEASLSFLGIGLQPPAISWGLAISQASGLGSVRNAPHMLLFPSLFLSLTVLSFIMLGDAVRDAIDPKLR